MSWLLLLACAGDTGSTDPATDSDPAPPGPFPGLVLLAWDGEQGLIATWAERADVATVAVTAEGPDGTTLAESVGGGDGEVWLQDLAEGTWQVRAEGFDGETSLGGSEVVLEQRVGVNRLTVLGQLEHRGLQDLWGEGDLVVAAGGLSPEADLLIADASDPTAPTTLATVDGLEEIRDVHLEDGLLYAASDLGDVGVYVFDLADPTAPEELARIDGAVHNLHFGDDHLYAADTLAQALSIYDVGDPTAPTWVAEWPMVLGVHDITWVDGLLYVASPSGLSILDVSDPTSPTPLLEHELALGDPGDGFHNVWPSDDGTWLYTTHEAIGGRMKVWQVGYGVLDEVTAWPDEEPNCAHNVVARGDRVYAAWYLEGARLLDVSDPATPTLMGWHDTFDEEQQMPGDFPDIRGAWGVWPFGEHVVVSDTETGLWWFKEWPEEVTAD